MLIAERYPMSSPETMTYGSLDEMEQDMRSYCVAVDIELHDVDGSHMNDHYISVSRCREI